MSVNCHWYTIWLIGILCLPPAVVANLVHPHDCKPAPTDTAWTNKQILHIGDSNLGNHGLKSTLRRKFDSAGARYKAVHWVGSNSRRWLLSGKLQRLLTQTAPDVVLVNLGTNAIKVKNPRAYAIWIERLAHRIAPRTCYWIAPPPFFADTDAFYEELARASHPCIFIDTRHTELQVEPAPRFHLSRKQSEKWAEIIWEAINAPNNPPHRQNLTIKDTDNVL